MDNQTWTTQNGRVIPISDLEDDHLINIIRMLERSNWEWERLQTGLLVTSYAYGAPDGAADAADQAADFVASNEWEPPVYTRMKKEAALRGLTWESALPANRDQDLAEVINILDGEIKRYGEVDA